MSSGQHSDSDSDSGLAREAFGRLLDDVRRTLDQRLATWLAPRVASAAQVSPEVLSAAEAIQRLSLRGGKRMRAALVGAAFDACRDQGGASAAAGAITHEAWAPAIPAMIGIELLQTYLLIH